MRFTLGKMFLAVAMLALACAGMTYGNRWWLIGITTLTLTIFVVAAITAVVHHDRRRAVLFGFCFAGLAYYYFSNDVSINPRLPTTVALAVTARAIDIGYEKLATDPLALVNAQPTLLSLEDYLRLFSTGSSEPLASFALIGHCVFSWIFAVLAAWFAGRIYDRERETKVTS